MGSATGDGAAAMIAPSSMLELWTGLVVVVTVTAGVAALRRWALHRLLDVPNERSLHSQPTPRGGGLVIVVAVLVGLAVILVKNRDWPWHQTAGFFAGALLIAGVSWLDDLRSLSNRLRIIVHFSAAAMMIAGSGGVIALPDTLPWVMAAGITLVWVAGLTNAYNFMDGIDGIAGLQGVVGGIAWFVLARDPANGSLSALGLLVALASLGFLFHNWPKARIFMGDVGSAFLGFVFASMPLLLKPPLPFLSALLVVWPFVFDTAFTFLRRLRRGERVFSAHRSHLYQRLVIAGWSHRRVTLLYGTLAATGSALAIWSEPRGSLGGFVAFGAAAGLGFLLWLFVTRIEART